MKYAYFRCENGYVGITDESPAGMKGFVFAGRGPRPGKGIESVCEQGYARSQLDKLERVQGDDVPDDWFTAIGYERRPKPIPESIPKPNIVPITIELPGDRLRRKFLAKPGDPGYGERDKEAVKSLVLLAISFAISWYVIVHLLKW